MGRASRSRGLVALATVAALVSAPAPAAAEAATGRIQGRVVLGVEGVRLADLGPLVVYVEREQSSDQRPPAARSPEVHQRNGMFSPGFMAVAKGTVVSMPNDDDVDHNVYSASESNEFDLGIYQAGETRSVTLENPGQVDVHCSIHESMNATIFVAPSPWFARVGPDGRFAIAHVPPGRYRLRTWSQRLPRTEMFLRVLAGETPEVTVRIGDDGSGG